MILIGVPKIAIPRTSLRLNLMVVCETLLLLFLSLAVLLYFSRQALKDEAKHDAEETLEGTVQHIDNILMSVEQSAYITYEDLKGHLNEPDRMVTYCREVVKNNPYVGGCAIAFKPHYFPGGHISTTYAGQATLRIENGLYKGRVVSTHGCTIVIIIWFRPETCI